MGIFYLQLHSYSSHAKTWLSIRKTGFRKRLKFSTSHFIRVLSVLLFSFWIDWLRMKDPRLRRPYLKSRQMRWYTCIHTYLVYRYFEKGCRMWQPRKHVTTPKGIVGCFWVHRFSRKFERMAGDAMDICLWVLKDSNKSIDHIPYYLSGLSRAHFFRQPLSK